MTVIDNPAPVGPEFPSIPDEGEVSGTDGGAQCLLYLYTSDAAETAEIDLANVGGTGGRFPPMPQVTFYKIGNEGLENEVVTAAALGAKWHTHQVVPGLEGLKIEFSNPAAAPLKKGETLGVCVVG